MYVKKLLFNKRNNTELYLDIKFYVYKKCKQLFHEIKYSVMRGKIENNLCLFSATSTGTEIFYQVHFQTIKGQS